MTEDWQNECLQFVGKQQRVTDELSPANTNMLFATLNDPQKLGKGDHLPPLFHWLHFNPIPSTENLKPDGHEKLGVFLPPVPYPRRMWAGSKVTFLSPVVLGTLAERISTIESVSFKSGKSGPLCFVNVKHSISQHGVECLTDTHTIVYREANNSVAVAKSIVDGGVVSEEFNHSVSSIVMFRYSALTFNSHRIHYDHDYVREQEGYPGLVVHGPLMATLLMRHALATHPEKVPTEFSFRGLAPMFEDEKFRINEKATGTASDLSLQKYDGTDCVSANVVWRA